MSAQISPSCFAPDDSGAKREDMLLMRLERAAEVENWRLTIDGGAESKIASLEYLPPAGAPMSFSVAFKDAQELVAGVVHYAEAFNAAERVVDQICEIRHKGDKISELSFIQHLVDRAQEFEIELRHLALVYQIMTDDGWYTNVNRDTALKIATSFEPQGLFLCQDGDSYLGISNETGKAWTEEFDNEADCLLWLADILEVPYG